MPGKSEHKNAAKRCRQKTFSEWLVYNAHSLPVGVEVSDVERILQI